MKSVNDAILASFFFFTSIPPLSHSLAHSQLLFIFLYSHCFLFWRVCRVDIDNLNIHPPMICSLYSTKFTLCMCVALFCSTNSTQFLLLLSLFPDHWMLVQCNGFCQFFFLFLRCHTIFLKSFRMHENHSRINSLQNCQFRFFPWQNNLHLLRCCFYPLSPSLPPFPTPQRLYCYGVFISRTSR